MESAIAAAAVKAVLGAVMKNLVAEAIKLVKERGKLLKDLPDDVEEIHQELGMIDAKMEDMHAGEEDPSLVVLESMNQMRDLAHDIEDCLDRILRSTTEGSKTESLVQLAKQVKKLHVKVKAAHERRKRYGVVNGAQPASATRSTTAVRYLPSPSSVAIDEPKRQIVAGLLTDHAEGLSEGDLDRPKVISIVGINGSGKTTLAKAVYKSDDVISQFPARAWVVASEHGDTKALLTELLGKLDSEQQAGDDIDLLQTKISTFLHDNRYLIVLDDIKDKKLWQDIQYTFPQNNRSGIIVTTTILNIAVTCSHGNGYVHNMKSLGKEDSKVLLKSIAPRKAATSLERSSTSIVNKCDGHPLSLATVAHYLQGKNKINKTFCDNLSRDLGYLVATESTFLALRNVLMNNYSSLHNKDLPNIGTCLMYMCVFPYIGCHIKGSRLMRRWLAEHYVQCNDRETALEVAEKYLEKLIDRNIINPIGTSKDRGVRNCRAHGIFHEFMLHMSRSANFVASLGDPNRRNYRHLFMEGRRSNSSGRSSNQNHGHNKNSTKYRKFVAKTKEIFQINKSFPENKEKEGNKLRAHSLTICGEAGAAAGEFVNCELLRVLDLEECQDLKDEDIDGIHELWHLKYLSLGAAFSRLPMEIEKLYCLETLDVRKTKKEIKLPLAVIKLPHLARLLGKFKLDKKDRKKNKLENYISKECNLETLAGFVTDDDPGFPLLMVHMDKLDKVKAWCNSVSKEFLDAIKKFIQTKANTPYGDRSLSLYLGHLVRNFVSSLEDTCGYLSSLKIHGALGDLDRLTLTHFTMSLSGLKVLCLSSTNVLEMDQDDLSNLGGLLCLEYLKLVKVSLRGLVIESLHFRELLCLCLVQSPALPAEVKEGALGNLNSLQLLAKDLHDLAGIRIEQHKLLQEVALDSKVNKETQEILERAAKEHPNRPSVLYLDRVVPDEGTESTVKYVVPKRSAPETTGSS